MGCIFPVLRTRADLLLLHRVLVPGIIGDAGPRDLVAVACGHDQECKPSRGFVTPAAYLPEGCPGLNSTRSLGQTQLKPRTMLFVHHQCAISACHTPCRFALFPSIGTAYCNLWPVVLAKTDSTHGNIYRSRCRH